MKITIESTSRIVDANGVRCRVWVGETKSGIKVQALIHGIALATEDLHEFERELQEQKQCRPLEFKRFRLV